LTGQPDPQALVSKGARGRLFSRPPPLGKETLPHDRPGNPQIRNKPDSTERPPEPQNPRSAGCRGIWWDSCSVNLVWFV
jgi:hypothetical protein